MGCYTSRLLYVYLFLFVFSGDVFSQKFEWAKKIGGDWSEFGFSVAVDNSGNVFVAGLSNSAELIIDTAIIKNPNNAEHAFLVKYDKYGQLQWARCSDGNGTDMINSLATDDSGNVYACGAYSSSLITFRNHSLTKSMIGFENFMVKYDCNGNDIWAINLGYTGNSSSPVKVQVDASQNVVITGTYFDSTLTIGNITIANAGLESDIFLFKLKSDGAAIWGQSFGGTDFEKASALVVDGYGEIDILGYSYSSKLSIGSILINNTPGIVLVKYNADGNLKWVKTIGNDQFLSGESVAACSNGDIFVVGNFMGEAVHIGNSLLSSKNSDGAAYDFYIAKYDSSGNNVWVKQQGGTSNDQINSVVVDLQDNVYIGGSFTSDTLTLGSSTLVNSQTYANEVFLAKMDTSGAIAWAKSASGKSADNLNSLAVYDRQCLYITGTSVSKTISFDNLQLQLAESGAQDLFLAKLNLGESSLISDKTISANDYLLYQNYPNPFNPSTTIEFSMPVAGRVTVDVFNSVGQKVAELVNAEQSAGAHKIIWDAQSFSSGIYFCELRSDKFRVVKKLMLLK